MPRKIDHEKNFTVLDYSAISQTHTLAEGSVAPATRRHCNCGLCNLASGWHRPHNNGHPPHLIAIAGDSAGGGLTVATLVAIRDAGLPMPSAAALLSPWVDLSLSGDSVVSRAGRDPMLSSPYIRFCAQAYCADRPVSHPGCSPLFADLRGLPPLLIQVGSEESIYSDSERLVELARRAQVEVDFMCYQGLCHVFQLFPGWLREANAAVAEIGIFFRQRWEATSLDAQHDFGVCPAT